MEAKPFGQVKIGKIESLKTHLKMSFFRSYTEISNLRTSWSPIPELSNFVILDLLEHWQPLVMFTQITWQHDGIVLLSCWLGIVNMASKELENVEFFLKETWRNHAGGHRWWSKGM